MDDSITTSGRRTLNDSRHCTPRHTSPILNGDSTDDFGARVQLNRRLLTALLIWTLTTLLGACGPESNDPDPDAGTTSDAADASPTERVCDPVSPECGGENWQFQSDETCPEERPQIGTSCENPRTVCYYCDDPDAASSEAGHPFIVNACAPNSTWELQELTCATQ